MRQRRMGGPVGGGFAGPGKRARNAAMGGLSSGIGHPSATSATAAAAAAMGATTISNSSDLALAAANASSGGVPGAVALPIAPSMGPTLQVQASFADQNNKRIVMALQSGLKSELAWALNALTLLSFKEKDDTRKESTPLAKIQGLLDALLHVIDEWRDIAHVKDSRKSARVRTLGSNSIYTGFGLEFEVSSTNDPLARLRSVSDNLHPDGEKGQGKQLDWWWDEEGLFNLDEIGRAERQQCAVAASNVLRNFSFMPENEVFMAHHRHCLETIIHCMEDYEIEDEELVTNAIETIVNLAPYLALRIFSDQGNANSRGHITGERALLAILKLLESPVKAWHCSTAELLGRLVVNPDNEPFLLPFASQVYKRLVAMLGFLGADSQASAVAALYNFAEMNMDCRLRLANERWAIARLLKIVQTPHPLAEVCRKAALTLESLASEPENRAILLAYEHTFAELALSDARLSDTFARILWELSSRSNSKSSARGIWGS